MIRCLRYEQSYLVLFFLFTSFQMWISSHFTLIALKKLVFSLILFPELFFQPISVVLMSICIFLKIQIHLVMYSIYKHALFPSKFVGKLSLS
jgi:hypothetical protein